MKGKSDKNRHDLEKLAAEIRNIPIDAQEEKKAAGRVWRIIEERLHEETDHETSDDIQMYPLPTGQLECKDFRDMFQAYSEKVLENDRALFLEDHLRECGHCRKSWKTFNQGISSEESSAFIRLEPRQKMDLWPLFGYAMAASLLLAIGVTMFWVTNQQTSIHSDQFARVLSVDGVILELGTDGTRSLSNPAFIGTDSILKTAKNSTMHLELPDKSRIEIDERSEFSLTEKEDGVFINLNRGNIIVQAAPQEQKHLYVHTSDCEIAVTGTIFTVQHGVKGSRVSVLEGEVHVNQNGTRKILHPGQQISTRANIEASRIEEEISWSSEVDAYLSLLQEVSAVQDSLVDHLSTKKHREYSPILEILPEDTVFYVSIPNLTEYVAEFRYRLDERIRSNPLLRRWWNRNVTQEVDTEFDIEMLMDRITRFGDHLDEEIVFTIAVDASGGILGCSVISEIKNEKAFTAYIQNLMKEEQFEKLGKQICLIQNNPPEQSQCPGELYIFIRNGFVALTPSLEYVRVIAQSIDHAPSEFLTKNFCEEILKNYQNRADWMVCADLQNIVSASMRKQLPVMSQQERGKFVEAFNWAGLLDLKHFILSTGGREEALLAKAVLTFKDNRAGIARWLEEPAPMKSLEFLSPDVSVFSALVFKDGAYMLGDFLEFIELMNPKFTEDLLDQKLNKQFHIFTDIAQALGGECAMAIDGPLFPVPSWKLIFEVYHEDQLNGTIDRMISLINEELAEQEFYLSHDLSELKGHPLHTIHFVFHELDVKCVYTYLDGYMIVCPSRTMLSQTLQNYKLGYSLLDSHEFIELLPDDNMLNFSYLGYEKLSSVLAPYLEKLMVDQGILNGDQVEKIKQLQSLKTPSLIYGYAEPDRIILHSKSESRSMLADAGSLVFRIAVAGFQQLFLQKMSVSVDEVQQELAVIGPHIEDYRRNKGYYPQSLGELGIPEIKYRDSFAVNGRLPELKYKVMNNGKDWLLYSVGPDLDDDRGKILYKNTNGLLSDGDIVLTSKQFHGNKR